MGSFLQRLQETGGLLRVRALAMLGFTGIGGAYMLIHEAMPPDTFNILWAGTVAYYFGTRGASGGGNGNSG